MWGGVGGVEIENSFGWVRVNGIYRDSRKLEKLDWIDRFERVDFGVRWVDRDVDMMDMGVRLGEESWLG